MAFEAQLEALKTRGQYRHLREVETVLQQRIYKDGKEWLNFTSNDYLGLGQRPLDVNQLQAYGEKYASHLASSRLVSGNSALYTKLEQQMGEALGYEAALIMASGYDANLAVFQIFKRQDVVIFSDALNHASIIDGIHLSRVKKVIFPHRDYDMLKKEMAKYPNATKVIVTDTVFSTNGHLVNLDAIRRLKMEFDNTIIVVDDSHGFGLGYDMSYDDIDVVTTSLSKGLGAHGGLILCSKVIKDMLVNMARPLIYSNCMPTMNLYLIEQQFEALEEAQNERERLHHNIQEFNHYFGSSCGASTAIKAIEVKNNKQANDVYEALLTEGIWVSLFRYPTVEKPTLRMSLSSWHKSKDIQKLIHMLQKGGVGGV
ncbi:aminotransferase class I/II-fold pyridoxal phosphate-dependent enzyme [Staphylococcus ratti]|uniref:Pyridoxal phosphate-dependent aminotransferase family protein n=1 Tax=Staphylococcus ratti TaxID=2892440 RepID=A0ABY3PD16_9STAP|nr:pyridoxal phosphate-dependent aminotransferase family protein [Staphylococcus ratti]UEX90227.1 pyridoxal phosphate-dependent aminotransferase family protein [Staphylococcus ratti]